MKEPDQKIKRNDPCPCGSGLQYKYCCSGIKLREKVIPVWEDQETGKKLSLNFTEDILNVVATSDLPLKTFCKDNGFYLFGSATTGLDETNLNTKLKAGTLTTQDVFDAFKDNSSHEYIFKILDFACNEMDCFKKFHHILREGFCAHFERRYILSIPVLFIALEGILREYGGLANKDNVKPVIPDDVWDNRMLFWSTDDAKHYNGFIQKLFAGSGNPSDFNRNPILHGINVNYHSEENSLLLILAILEIRNFDFFYKNSEDLTKRFDVTKGQFNT